MNIDNIRLGFATNSSSSHSVIISADKTDDWNTEDNFCWNDFLLRSKEGKQNYLASQLSYNLQQTGFTEEFSNRISYFVTKGKPLSLDHQSALVLPRKHRSFVYSNQKHQIELDLDFFNELTHYLTNDDKLVVTGGNDNDTRYNYGGVKDLIYNSIPKDEKNEHFICRKDGDFWTIFNKLNGTKIRLSFTSKEKYNSSKTPELCDIKLTDFCPYGCDFCYQGSTIKGRHCTLDNIMYILKVLGDNKVFEVAYGGGETTLHPDFLEILYKTVEHDIVPNFTTFNLKCFENTDILKAINEVVGGVAVSINYKDYSLLLRLQQMVEKFVVNRNKIIIQGILGVLGTKEILDIIDSMKYFINLTLLGYKSFGRGISLKDKKDVDITKIISYAKSKFINLSLDTVAVKEYYKDLRDMKISDKLMTKHEGKFSCYIDACKNILSKDSYSDDVVKFNNTWNSKNNLENTLGKYFPYNN